MNSLLTVIAIFVFIGIGYTLMVKPFNRSYRDDESPNPAFDNPPTILGSIQSIPLLFIAITTTISLYWGWAPAILWTVIGSLFIHFNLATILHERLIDETQSSADNELISHYFAEQTHGRKLVGINILNIFSAFSFVLLIVLASELLGQYTGSAIAVAAICLAILTWQTSHKTKTSMLISISIALIGIAISDKIGFYFIGNWQPISNMPALVIDERWLFALILMLIFKQLRATESEPLTQFLNTFSKVSAYSSFTLFLAALVYLIIERPLIDAPIHTQSNQTPSYFLIIALITTVGVINLSRYLQNLRIPLKAQQSSPSINRRYHGKIMFEVICLITLLFLFASSKGIGAWSSHFLNWDANRSLLDHLNLAITSISSLFENLPHWGINETSAKHIVATILLLNGLSLLNENSLNNQFLQQELDDEREPSRYQSSIINIGFYGLLATLLVYGATINTWLLLGSLSLAGTAWILLCDSHLSLDCEIHNPTILLVTLAILLIAALQLVAQCWIWWAEHQWFYAISGTTLALSFLFLAITHTPSMLSKYSIIRKKTPLSLDDDKNGIF